jgi:transcriptional regulator with AAA-type ATPase domain
MQRGNVGNFENLVERNSISNWDESLSLNIVMWNTDIDLKRMRHGRRKRKEGRREGEREGRDGNKVIAKGRSFFLTEV